MGIAKPTVDETSPIASEDGVGSLSFAESITFFRPKGSEIVFFSRRPVESTSGEPRALEQRFSPPYPSTERRILM